MKLNKLKVISITVFCCVASFWSETKCMDGQRDTLESATLTHTSSMQVSTQNEMSDLVIPQEISDVTNLKDQSKSWLSYFAYSIKTAVQTPQKIIKYVINNPQKGMIIGLFITYQYTTAAAACWCYCLEDSGWRGNGLARVPEDCEYMCGCCGNPFHKCENITIEL